MSFDFGTSTSQINRVYVCLTKDTKIFQKIVQDIFCKDDVRLQMQNQHGTAHQSKLSLEKLIGSKALNDYNLSPNQNWIEKCLQIHAISKVNRAVILVGSPGTGKTSTLTVLCDALSEFSRSNQTNRSTSTSSVFKQHVSATHKLKKFFFLMFFFLYWP
jgi:hypothetical protein